LNYTKQFKPVDYIQLPIQYLRRKKLEQHYPLHIITT